MRKVKSSQSANALTRSRLINSFATESCRFEMIGTIDSPQNDYNFLTCFSWHILHIRIILWKNSQKKTRYYRQASLILREYYLWEPFRSIQFFIYFRCTKLTACFHVETYGDSNTWAERILRRNFSTFN